MADTPGGDGADLGSAAAGGSVPAPAAPVRVVLAGEPFSTAARRIAGDLAEETVASRVADGDPSVWPAVPGSGTGWTGLARASRPLTGQIAALRERFAVLGAHRVLLVGTPDAVAVARLVAAGSPDTTRLTALDSADPVQVAEALSREPAETVLVVADPAGDDPVVGAVRHAVVSVLADEIGADALTGRTVHLTEPGSPLDTPGAGVTVVTLDADVPARFGALGPLGLVPAGLAGADVAGLLATAVPAAATLGEDDPENPALLLAGALAAAGGSVLALRDDDRSPALTAWLAPLLTAAGLAAVPTGPDAPVPAPQVADPAAPPPVVDVHADGTGPAPSPGRGAVRTDAPPGATIVLWQVAAALAARARRTDPFAPGLPAPDPGEPEDPPAFVDGGIAVHADGWLPSGVDTVAGALDALAAVADDGGHLAVSAWLDPESDASVAVLRGPLAGRTGLPVAFGWAPGCRSGDTGGPDRAVHCHLTGGGLDPDGSGAAPDDPFGAGTAPEPSGLDSLHAAQARAVVREQRSRGRPVLRLHLTDRLTGLVTLARAVETRPDH
ncbi:glucose-6-phosphate isomerase [Pseudonocardia kongjuensis]|uniref:Glucose-6-phosphate isomerase n=1 Tax=Pseudonocardia kongjuensis TaxID=102227 RepID=A0ABP4IZU1_9PSEU